jgi:hypothetical protein
MVALLTPVVALAAGGAATWLADNLGIQVDAAELQAIFVAAIVAVLAPAAQWLYGSQKFERHQAELEQLALKADTEAAARASEVDMEAAAGAYEDDYEDDAGDDADGYYDDEYADDDEDDYDDYESAREEQPAAY